jgi:hypothetical protein
MRLVLALLGLLLVPPALAEARPAGSHSVRSHHAQGRHKHRKHRRHHKHGRAKHRKHRKHSRNPEF